MKAFSLRSIFRSAGTLTATAILLFALLIALGGALTTRNQLRDAFDHQKRIAAAQLDLEELLKLQLDEETAVRGYTITRDDAFLQPYKAAMQQFEPLQNGLRSVLRQETQASPQALKLLTEFSTIHEDWHRSVAEPLIRRRANSLLLEKRGKFMVDAERADGVELKNILLLRSDEVSQQTQDAINRSENVRSIWLVVFGLLAILFNIYRWRTNRELEEERTTTEILQRAFQSEVDRVEGADVGSVYISATEHAAVGGDVFDLYKLSERLWLVLIADVSGKGVDAAVITAFIKFTIRGIALRRRDPAAILSEFNTAFPRTVSNPSLFVSMLVGILDTGTLTLTYASGGHDSAYVRHQEGSVEQLTVTGPVLGVMEEPFHSRNYALAPGDAIVLATDGLTEARNSSGELIAEGAMDIISHAQGNAQQMVDEIVRRVRAHSGAQISDDLAILAIRISGEAGTHA